MNYQNFSEEIFKKVFFEWKFKTSSLFQHFNSSAFLSRKRVQNYCFTAYTPNLINTFLLTFCILLHKSLILKRSVKHKKGRETCAGQVLYLVIYCARIRLLVHILRGFPKRDKEIYRIYGYAFFKSKYIKRVATEYI